MRSADPLNVFDRAIGEVIVMFVPTNVLRNRSGDKQWFDASCRRAYDYQQTVYRAWCRARSADHWGQFVLARAEAQRVYRAARETHNERTRNTLKHFTFSNKWRETLKGSIFGVSPSIPALSGPTGGLVVAPVKKLSLLGSQFKSKQYHEQFVTPLSCFPRSMCNYLAFRTPALRLLLDLDTYGGVDPLGVIYIFPKMVLDIIAPKLSKNFFCGLIRRGSFPVCWLSANVTAIPKGAPSTDFENYRPLSITPILSKVYEKLVSNKLSSFCKKCVFLIRNNRARNGLKNIYY